MPQTAQPKCLTLQQLSELLAPDTSDSFLVPASLLETFEEMQKAGYQVREPKQIPLSRPRPGHTAWEVEIVNPASDFAGSIWFSVPTNTSPRSNP